MSRYAIVVGTFYEDLAERLMTSAQAAFAEAGAEGVDVFEVPGAFELPLAAKYAAESGLYDGVAALGAVIRGETSHYDHVCEESARGLMDVQLRTGVPCAFGVLTVESHDQAIARSGGGKRDQGRHAAEAVLALAALRETLSPTVSGELLSIILLLGVHIAGLGYLFWYALSSDGLTLRDMFRGGGEDPEDGFPSQDPPAPAPSGGGLPLPGTDPSARRLRGPSPIGDAYPPPSRRPDHAPERVPSGEIDRRS